MCLLWRTGFCLTFSCESPSVSVRKVFPSSQKLTFPNSESFSPTSRGWDHRKVEKPQKGRNTNPHTNLLILIPPRINEYLFSENKYTTRVRKDCLIELFWLVWTKTGRVPLICIHKIGQMLGRWRKTQRRRFLTKRPLPECISNRRSFP